MISRTTLITAFVASLIAGDCRDALSQNLNMLRLESREPNGGAKQIDLSEFDYIGSPTFSSDVEWIAFDAYKGGYQGAAPECWIMRMDGTQRRKVATGQTPRWSPDGKQLVFMRERERDRKLGLGIFVVNVDGTGERRIGDGRWPDWSPDGQRLVFAIGGHSDRGGAWSGARVCISDFEGGEVDEVAIGDCPSWSPDGKKIACCYSDPAIGAPLVRVIDLETKTQKFAGYGWYRANWAADGMGLYANGVNDAGRAGMFKMGLDQKQKAQPLFAAIPGESPCESRDGRQIVFCAVSPKR
jgi:dipeptidyl aminopeptidase/acylaminoacyl peptidase